MKEKKKSKDVDNGVTKASSKWRELSGVICDKKVPTKLKILIYQTVIQPTLLYGCETWPMSVLRDEKRNREENDAMGLLRRNDEIHGDRYDQLANSPVLQISWINN